MSSEAPPPSREELIARFEKVQRDAQELRRELAAASRPQYGRLAALVAAVLAVAVGTYWATESVGYTLLAVVGLLVLGVVALITLVPTPATERPGTRAFEARMTADLLVQVIEARRQQQAATPDPEERARLDREIAFLEQQLEAHRAVDPGDDSPGRGTIGFTPYDGP